MVFLQNDTKDHQAVGDEDEKEADDHIESIIKSKYQSHLGKG